MAGVPCGYADPEQRFLSVPWFDIDSPRGAAPTGRL